MFDIGFSELVIISLIALIAIGPKRLPQVARTEGAGDGFRIIVNTGRVGHQEVYHVHMHILGGPEPLGPMLLRRK